MSYSASTIISKNQKEFIPAEKEKDILALWEYSRKFLPKSSLIHNCLRLNVDKRLSDKFQSTFYTYGGSFNETHDDNFVLCVQHNHYLKDRNVLFLVPKVVTEEMLHAIESLIDWNTPHTFGELEDPLLCTALENMCKRHKHPVLRGKYFTNTFKEQEENLPYPDEVGIRSLTAADAPIINDTWSYKLEGTLEMLQDLIEKLDSVGLYLKSTGQLVSWQLIHPLGFTTAMYTLKEYRGKGYASVTLKELGKIFKTKNMLANNQVSYANTSSNAAIQRSGWESVVITEWLEYDHPYLNH